MVTLREEMLSHAPSASQAIVVDPQARGNGLGKRLMEHCEQRVQDLGARSLTLHMLPATSAHVPCTLPKSLTS